MSRCQDVVGCMGWWGVLGGLEVRIAAEGGGRSLAALAGRTVSGHASARGLGRQG